MVKTGSAGWYATHVSKPFVILLIMALKQFNHESSVKERRNPSGNYDILEIKETR